MRSFIFAAFLSLTPVAAQAQSECQLFNSALDGMTSPNPGVSGPSQDILRMAYNETMHRIKALDNFRVSRGCRAIVTQSPAFGTSASLNNMKFMMNLCNGNPDGDMSYVAETMYNIDEAIGSTGYGQPAGCN